MKTLGTVVAWCLGALAVGAAVWVLFGWGLWPDHAPPDREGAAFAVGWYGAYVPVVFLTGAAILLPITLVLLRRRDRVSADPSPPASPGIPLPPPPPARR